MVIACALKASCDAQIVNRWKEAKTTKILVSAWVSLCCLASRLQLNAAVTPLQTRAACAFRHLRCKLTSWSIVRRTMIA